MGAVGGDTADDQQRAASSSCHSPPHAPVGKRPRTDSQQGTQQRLAPRALAVESFHDLRALRPPQRLNALCGSSSTASSTGARELQPAPISIGAVPWRTFSTQRAAFEYADASPCAHVLRTYAVEVDATGRRCFIVTSDERLWREFFTRPAAPGGGDAGGRVRKGGRHLYEIIREGAPCHLYFDLEYSRAANPSARGPALVAALLSAVAEVLHELYGLHWSDTYALELDSSTADKFSRHVIVRLPGAAFADAGHAGRVARLALLRGLRRAGHCSAAAAGPLLLAPPTDRRCAACVRCDGSTGATGCWGGSSGCSCSLPTSIVDMGVYTRNR
jgi:hypothetical protein